MCGGYCGHGLLVVFPSEHVSFRRRRHRVLEDIAGIDVLRQSSNVTNPFAAVMHFCIRGQSLVQELVSIKYSLVRS